MKSPNKFGIWPVLKYHLRGLMLTIDSLFLGRGGRVSLPNGKQIFMRFSLKSSPTSQRVIDHEIGGYWQEHRPQKGEVHLDVGAQVGSYTMLATSSGATVYAFEPDPNNRRFLRRNLKMNGFACTVVEKGAWNEYAFLPWRTQAAISSIRGVGALPSSLPSLDQIEVDRLDKLVESFNLSRVDVIKMDIEGAEIEALEGAENIIKKFRPLLLVEAYHLRDGRATTDRVLTLLEGFGIPKSCIIVTHEGLVVARGY